MFFDWLSDNIKDPKLVLFDVEIEDSLCTCQILFVRAYIKHEYNLRLKNKENKEILLLDLPKVFYMMSKDLLYEKESTLKIAKMFYGQKQSGFF